MTVTHPLADRDVPTPAAVTAPDGRTYAVADDGAVECPDDVAAELAAALAERYDTAREEDGPPDADTDEPAPLDPGDHTVADLREAIADIDDADALRAVGDAEEAGENRTTALEAIDARLSELRG
jgi:hypothetical protein